MKGLFERIEDAQHTVARAWSGKPTVGIILGTGLGSLAKEIETDVAIPYAEVPHFPESTVESHAGRLVCGNLAGVPVIAMEGRFHLYEGYSQQEITFPVRLMKAMGCGTLVVSNACGGLNPQYSAGDVMIIEDHINLLAGNPLVGVNDDRLGPRFPDMSEPYCRKLIAQARKIALEEKITVQQGVYTAVIGPNLETRAEYRFLRTIGADVVGMSTIPECIVARHSGMKVLGFSVVTDMCLPDALEEAVLSKILAIAGAAEPKLRTLVREAVRFIGSQA
jgi:purine-nucleoside phosphorylase